MNPPSRRCKPQLAAQRLSLYVFGGDHRHQPAVPEQTKPGFLEEQRKVIKMPDRTKNSANRISRRAVLRGAGVTMALPWLESLPAFAGATTAPDFPEALRGSVHGEWRERGSLGRRGFGRRDEAQQDAGAARAAEAQDQRDSRPFPQAGHGPGHSPARRPAACSPARTFRRAPSSRRASRSISDRQSHRPGYRRSPASCWLASSR